MDATVVLEEEKSDVRVYVCSTSSHQSQPKSTGMGLYLLGVSS